MTALRLYAIGCRLPQQCQRYGVALQSEMVLQFAGCAVRLAVVQRRVEHVTRAGSGFELG